MVSFMQEYRKYHRLKPGDCTFLAGIFCLLIVLAIPTPAYADGFKILSAKTELKDNVYQLQARMSLKFSNDALEALRSGVPLIVLVNIEVLKDRSWWWDKTVAELEQGYLVLYHALSEKYIIHNLNSASQKNYISLSAALSALGNIQNLPILDKNLIDDDDDYYVQMRTYLDIESLPAPMRPIAYISSQWKLGSDWYSWPLKQ